MMDYIEAIEPKYITILIKSDWHNIEQCKLKDHYKLRSISESIVGDSIRKQINAILEYIKVALHDDKLYEELINEDIESIPAVYEALLRLNDHEISLLPWQQTFKQESQTRFKKRSTADYDNRQLTVLIHTIAQAYGWSEDQILQLTPESAYCYVQEIMLDQWKEHEFMYKLSTVAYDKDGKYKKFTQLDWYSEIVGPTVEEAKSLIPRRFMPTGVVISNVKDKEEDQTQQQ